jgi:cytochrome P450
MSVADRVEIDFDQHTPEYRASFPGISQEVRAKCPVAWSTNHGGYWVVSGHRELSELSKRADLLSNEHDLDGTRRGYDGISIPPAEGVQAGFLEMDPPEQLEYRRVLNPFLAPAAVVNWQPLLTDFTRACIDEAIQSGRIDFVDDLANVVPAVLTMAMLGLPLADWDIYCEPTHALVYTPKSSPDWPRVNDMTLRMVGRLAECVAEARVTSRPGMIRALIEADVAGRPLPDAGIISTIFLLIGGGFDTTTSLLASSLGWLDDHVGERRRLLEEPGLINTATEEFLRFYTPAQGGGRTITQDCEAAGHRFSERDRIFLSYAMCNHDPDVFPDPDEIVLDRFPNRHAAFGLGVHRCIGSNIARVGFKTLLREVLRRLPDYRIDRDGVVQYESIGIINGYKHLPATFTPGRPEGPSLQEVMDRWQARLDAERCSRPSRRAWGSPARISPGRRKACS